MEADVEAAIITQRYVHKLVTFYAESIAPNPNDRQVRYKSWD